jgi:phenylacetate-CoA ligase
MSEGQVKLQDLAQKLFLFGTPAVKDGPHGRRNILMSNFYRLSASEQRKQSFKKLRTYVQDIVYPYHPAFRRACIKAGVDPLKIRTYEDFQRLPIMTKQEYRNEPLAYILQPTFPGKTPLYETTKIGKKYLLKYAAQSLANWPKVQTELFRTTTFKEKMQQRACREWFPIHTHASSGSTGEPTPSVYTHWDLDKILPELAYFVTIRGDKFDASEPRMSFDQRRMSLFPGAPHLAFFQAVISKMAVGANVFDTFGGKVIPTDRQIEIFSKGKFNTVGSIPSYLVYWLRRAIEMMEAGKIEPFGAGFVCAVLGAEPVSPSLRQHIHELAAKLGAHPKFKIMETYGSTELKWAGTECDEGSGIHLNPKYYFWEVLHPETKQPVATGEPGVLVFSHIGWRGTAFIRYWTGDLVMGGHAHETCKHCGYSFFRINSPIARADKDFTKIKGQQVALQELVTMIRDTEGVRNCQVILEKEGQSEFGRDLFLLRILPEKGVDRVILEQAIKYGVKAATEITPDQITFEDNSEKFEMELFARTGIKADYVIERRAMYTNAGVASSTASYTMEPLENDLRTP